VDSIPETDHFKLLEDKVGELIKRLQILKNEKESYLKTINEQKNQIAQLANEINDLKDIKNKAKGRVTSILEKIDSLDI
jgi:chromosome segregation ATPase